MLLRADDYLGTGDIAELLDGTDWDMFTKLMSAQLSLIYKAVVSKRISHPDKQGYAYQLRDLGEDWIEQLISEMPGYSLTTADKATGTDTDADQEAHAPAI